MPPNWLITRRSGLLAPVSLIGCLKCRQRAFTVFTIDICTSSLRHPVTGV
jgi:hypothetical protein